MKIMFDDIEVIKKRARAHDPVTSVAAAERSARFAASHAGRVYRALQELGTATAGELEAHTGLTVVQIARRLPELQRDGMVEVLQLNGEDIVREGFRVWLATKKISSSVQQTGAIAT